MRRAMPRSEMMLLAEGKIFTTNGSFHPSSNSPTTHPNSAPQFCLAINPPTEVTCRVQLGDPGSTCGRLTCGPLESGGACQRCIATIAMTHPSGTVKLTRAGVGPKWCQEGSRCESCC